MSPRTQVVVDGTHLGGYSANRGIGTFVRHLLEHLEPIQDLKITAIVRRGTVLPLGITPLVVGRWAPDRFARREHDLRLPHDLRRASADVVLSPADDPPRSAPAPVVQLLHDLIPLAYPHPELRADARRWQQVGTRLRAAASVIADSEHSARDAVRLLGIAPHRLTVSYPGVGAEFTPATTVSRRSRALLHVGEYGPHKGFADAFAVADQLVERGRPHDLQMVGFIAPWHRARVADLLASVAHPDRISFTGFVDDLVGAYQRASAVVVTSRYEGFGLPIIEAMACGTPVVTYDNSSLAEVAGDAALVVADGDVEAMAAAVARIDADPQLAGQLSALGIERSRSFRWERTAGEVAAVLRRAAGTG